MVKITKDTHPELVKLLQQDEFFDYDEINRQERNKGGTYYCQLLATVDDDLINEAPEYAALKGHWLSEVIVTDTDYGFDDYDYLNNWTKVEQVEKQITVTEWVAVETNDNNEG